MLKTVLLSIRHSKNENDDAEKLLPYISEKMAEMTSKLIRSKVGKNIPIEIRSDTISLRQYTLKDVGEAFALIDRNRKHLSQFGDETAIKYLTREAFEKSIRNPKILQKLRFGIRNKYNVLVGTINLTPYRHNTQKGEIGYYLGQEFQGNGYMTMAVRLLTDYAFNSLGYKELVGRVAVGNYASARVLENSMYCYSGINGDGQAIYKRLRRKVDYGKTF